MFDKSRPWFTKSFHCDWLWWEEKSWKRQHWDDRIKTWVSLQEVNSRSLPETQKSSWRRRCMMGYPDLRGCAEMRPTRESPLDCNEPPEHDKTLWDGHRPWLCEVFSRYIHFYFLTWCGSGAILFLNRWNTLLSSVSCIAMSSRSVSARAEQKMQGQDKGFTKTC